MSNPFAAYGPRRVLHAATVALLSAAPLACGRPLTVADQYKTLGVTEVELFSGLVQRISVTPRTSVASIWRART